MRSNFQGSHIWRYELESYELLRRLGFKPQAIQEIKSTKGTHYGPSLCHFNPFSGFEFWHPGISMSGGAAQTVPQETCPLLSHLWRGWG